MIHLDKFLDIVKKETIYLSKDYYLNLILMRHYNRCSAFFLINSKEILTT